MIKVKGLDELQRGLRRLQDRARALEGSHSVPVEELLTPGFMRRHVRGCSTAEEWFQRSGFRIDSQEDFKAIPDDAWDEYVRSSTSFSTWQGMIEAAGAAMIEKKLFG